MGSRWDTVSTPTAGAGLRLVHPRSLPDRAVDRAPGHRRVEGPRNRRARDHARHAEWHFVRNFGSRKSAERWAVGRDGIVSLPATDAYEVGLIAWRDFRREPGVSAD